MPGRSSAKNPMGLGRQTALPASVAKVFRREVAPGGVLLHLPRRSADANVPLLLAAAKAAIKDMEARLFVLVHHGDPGVAIVRSLHQEAHSLTTRVVQIPEHHPDALSWLVAEAKAAAPYLECCYDEAGERSERRLRVLPVAPGSDASLPLGESDVLLVTGGGKGIAAECALGLARESGCALGIVGRSSPDIDRELASNLARLRGAGVRTTYAAADVCDRDAVARAIDEIEAVLGPVTALVHGAGSNTPASLVSLESQDFIRTLAPETTRTRVSARKARAECAALRGRIRIGDRPAGAARRGRLRVGQ